MAKCPDNAFRRNPMRKNPNGRQCCPREGQTANSTFGQKSSLYDRKTVAGWIRQNCDEVQTNDGRCERNQYERHQRRYDEELSEESLDRPLCTKDLHVNLGPSTSRGPCPRKDVIAKLAPTTDESGIREVIEQVENEEITTAAEFIFSLTPYVRDKGLLFRETLEKELNYFREIVNDTVDRQVQDEADVMMHTQNKIKNKFKSLTHEMTQRTMRIRQRLYEISPKFNWAVDGRDKAKIWKIIGMPTSKKDTSAKEDNTSNAVDKQMHQVFMRGRWLKKELNRLQEENNNLEIFLAKFRKLASERKEQASYVPQMLSREKEELERELKDLRKTYKRNFEIINALYVELHRCIKPPAENSVHDGR